MILPYVKVNKAGQKISYWTHSSFIDQSKFITMEQNHKTRCTYRNYFGLLGGLIGLKLSSIEQFSKIMPKNIPAPGAAALLGLAFYAVGHLAFVRGRIDKDIADALEHQTIPLWKSKNHVVNMDRSFFHLDQSKNYTPDLIYHGLTAENASKIFPDAINGPLPKAPAAHNSDNHHHDTQHH